MARNFTNKIHITERTRERRICKVTKTKTFPQRFESCSFSFLFCSFRVFFILSFRTIKKKHTSNTNTLKDTHAGHINTCTSNNVCVLVFICLGVSADTAYSRMCLNASARVITSKVYTGVRPCTHTHTQT